MRFEFIPCDTLPRLAWCAHLRRGHDVVEVRHGPWVETAADWFVDGAWSGPFGGAGMVEATCFVGTGARVEGRRVVFCSPTSLADRIHSVRIGDDLYLSNSIAFLLCVTGDEPDPFYPYYAADRMRHLQRSLRHPDKRLRTRQGRTILVHEFCNVAVDDGLALRRLERPAHPPPVDYADLVAQLQGDLGPVVANAADPSRRHRRYRPVASISRGYESPALAALLRRHGAREALTFCDNPEDDGTPAGERLGYRVTGYERLGFQRLPGAVEAEFLVTPGIDFPMAVCESQLVGALFVTGRDHGSYFLTGASGPPDLGLPSPGAVGGNQMTEFRLRVGFLHLVPLYGLVWTEAIHAISVSPAMKPWSIGGYDKPIPRRIVEEAGVPREWFGQAKHASARHWMRTLGEMSPDGAADFMAHRRTMPPMARARRATHRGLTYLERLHERLIRRRGVVRLWRILGLRAPRRSLALARYRYSLGDLNFAFHWAFARIRSRYEG